MGGKFLENFQKLSTIFENFLEILKMFLEINWNFFLPLHTTRMLLHNKICIKNEFVLTFFWNAKCTNFGNKVC